MSNISAKRQILVLESSFKEITLREFSREVLSAKMLGKALNLLLLSIVALMIFNSVSEGYVISSQGENLPKIQMSVTVSILKLV